VITDATTVQAAAEIYAGMGLAPIPIHGIINGKCSCSQLNCPAKTAGKHPVDNAWQKRATDNLDAVRDAFRSHRGNIGIYLRNRFVLIDADGDLGLETIANLDLPETMRAVSGSGNGAHLIYRLAPHQDAALITDRQKVLPGVDVKLRGQFVAPPSLHISGNRYQWIKLMEPALLPDRIYAMIRTPDAPKALVRATSSSNSSVTIRRMSNWIAKADAATSGERGHGATMRVASKICAQGLSEAEEWDLLCEYNQRCSPPWNERELRHKHSEGRTKGKGTPLEDRPLLRSVPAGAAEIPEIVEDDTWHKKLTWKYTKHGQQIDRVADNIVVILEHDPQWIGKIRLDTFAQKISVSDAPWFDHQAPATLHQHWEDNDTTRLQGWLVREYSLDFSIADIDRSVAITAERHSHSSAKDWMETLVWDQTCRLNTWAIKYLGVPDTAYARMTPRLWLISAVARTYEPGCKADHVLILEGSQGLGKSSALRVLAGSKWFNDTAFDIGNKDAYMSIQGKLIVEMAELDSLKRSDADRAKAFFTSPVDHYRAPYARRVVSVDRQCVFAGTTNNHDMLKDETGNRRYWPVRCNDIDIAGLKSVRDQLWAEAIDAYKNGAPWYPETASDRALCEVVQEEHHVHNEWETIITEWAEINNIKRATAAEVAERALKMAPKDLQTAQQLQIAKCLKRCGWTSKRDTTHRYWVVNDGTPSA
jgi:predicted P-loop ATPase